MAPLVIKYVLGMIGVFVLLVIATTPVQVTITVTRNRHKKPGR